MKATHKLITTAGYEHDVYADLDEWVSVINGAKFLHACMIRSITPIPSEPETFDWKTAMNLFADGVEIEVYSYSSQDWLPVNWRHDKTEFWKCEKYRVKPTAPPEPKVYWVNWIESNNAGCCCETWTTLELAELSPSKVLARFKVTVTEGKALPVVEVIPV